MTKNISRFRIEPYGFFIDLADEIGRIGIDAQTGDIFLDEGPGPDRFQGAIIRAREFKQMDFVPAEDGASGQVILHFGKNASHVLGVTVQPNEAVKWTEKASHTILAHSRTEPSKKLEPNESAVAIPFGDLSEREFQVLRAIADGQSTKEIASSLSLSAKTVGTYRARILLKLKLRSKTDADLVRYCLEHRLLGRASELGAESGMSRARVAGASRPE